MDVHAHHNFTTCKFPEGMLDAVGDIGGQAHLRQHLHISGSSLLLKALLELQSLLTSGSRILVIIDDV